MCLIFFLVKKELSTNGNLGLLSRKPLSTILPQRDFKSMSLAWSTSINQPYLVPRKLSLHCSCAKATLALAFLYRFSDMPFCEFCTKSNLLFEDVRVQAVFK